MLWEGNHVLIHVGTDALRRKSKCRKWSIVKWCHWNKFPPLLFSNQKKYEKEIIPVKKGPKLEEKSEFQQNFQPSLQRLRCQWNGNTRIWTQEDCSTVTVYPILWRSRARSMPTRSTCNVIIATGDHCTCPPPLPPASHLILNVIKMCANIVWIYIHYNCLHVADTVHNQDVSQLCAPRFVVCHLLVNTPSYLGWCID